MTEHRSQVSHSILSLATRMLDALVVAVAGLASYWFRFSTFDIAGSLNYEAAILFGLLTTLVVFPASGIYTSWRGKSPFRMVRTVVLAWGTVLITLVLLAFITKTSESYSRLWFGYWAYSGFAGLLLLRLGIYATLRFARRKGWNHKKILVIGAGAVGRKIARTIPRESSLGIDVVGMLDDSPELQGKHFGGIRVLGPLKDINRFADPGKIHEVWIALPLRAVDTVQTILHELRHSTATIRYVPDIFGFRLLNHSVAQIGGLPVIDLNATPMSGVNQVVKAIEDRGLALLILTMIAPLMLVIAIGIKVTSPGPVLFTQKRHGWDGKPINVYKFRTMKVHQEPNGRVVQATRNDPRITRIGRFLRRTSLDELPQFFNVLQGRMSIVGPRPHAIAHNESYKDQVEAYMLRHKVKPGITGWAQVNGWRGETDTLEKMRRRVEYDLYYIENWSFTFDLRIILLTIFRGFAHRNAY